MPKYPGLLSTFNLYIFITSFLLPDNDSHELVQTYPAWPKPEDTGFYSSNLLSWTGPFFTHMHMYVLKMGTQIYMHIYMACNCLLTFSTWARGTIVIMRMCVPATTLDAIIPLLYFQDSKALLSILWNFKKWTVWISFKTEGKICWSPMLSLLLDKINRTSMASFQDVWCVQKFSLDKNITQASYPCITD